MDYEKFKKGLPGAGAKNFSLASPNVFGSLSDSQVSDWATKKWQKVAWSLYDQLGEVHFAAEYFGNAIAQANVTVGELSGSKVVGLSDENAAMVSAVADPILGRLSGLNHGMDQFLRLVSISLFVCGEVWIVAESDKGKDFYKVVPSASVSKDVNGVEGYTEGGEFKPFRGERARVWRPDPRDPVRPTSNLQGVLHTGNTLLMLDRLVRGTIRSRTHAGILKVPSEISFTPNPGYSGGKDSDPLGDEIFRYMSQPIQNEDSASSVVPMLMRGQAEYLKEVELLSMERGFDEFMPELMEKYKRRLALGLDLPAEVLLGMGNSNHWAAWFLSAEFVRLHAKPFLNLVTSVLTIKFLHPALEAAGVPNFKRFCFTFDELALVVQANKAQNAQNAKAMGLISDAAYRHHMGFAESDAPSDDDVGVVGGVGGRDPVDVENPEINPIGEDE